MARVIKMDKALERQYESYKKRAVVCLIIGGSLMLTAVLLGLLWVPFAAFPCVLLAQPAVIIGGIMGQKASALHAGVQGETAAVQLLATLPEGYFILQNLTVRYEDKPSEIDAVVVGPTGVFAVEAKNHNGQIVGDGAERQWTQHKIGRGGTPYSKSFYSPVKQVRTHVYRLANLVRDNGFRLTVESAVYFSNPETQVHLSNADERTPVFSAAEWRGSDLLAHLTGRSATLSPDTVCAIVDFLKKQH